MLIIIAGMQLYIAAQKNCKSDLVIENESIKRAVEISMNDYCLTKEEALSVKVLDLSSGVDLQSFKELDCFENVETITFDNSKIKSFSGIEDLHNLKTLSIKESTIKSVSELKNLKLRQLEIVDCLLLGTVNLGKMQYLETLNLSDNLISVMKGNYPNLKVLKLNNNDIADINDIEMPITIEELHISGNRLTSLEGIQKYDSINKLNITRMDLDNCDPIKNLESLNALYIDKDDMNSSLDYLFDNFRNGDYDRKKEYISRQYQIEE